MVSEEQKAVMRKRYTDNREKYLSDMKEYRKTNYRKIRERQKEWKARNPAKYLLQNCRLRAKKLGLDFDLSPEDISVPTHCPYLGCELTTRFEEGFVPTNMSVDRIDNSKGYVKGNVQIVSRRANSMKSDASPEELIRFARSILDVYA